MIHNTKKIFLCFALILFIGGVGIYTSVIKLPIEREIHKSYVANFDDNRVLVGASHNIFIAQVIEKVGNKDTGIGPVTQYKVNIIDNIKGELYSEVIVEQQAGYKAWYII